MGARFTFTDQGSGTANTAPLDPLRDGTLRGGLLLDGTVDLPTGRARRVIELTTNEVTYVLETKVGLFIGGGQLDGILEAPVLLVPTTVRVGMKWEVRLKDDKVAYTFEVVSRTEAVPSAFGKTTQWAISQKDSTGSATTRVYAEGIGIAESAGGYAVIPLETPDPEPSTAPRVAIELMPRINGDFSPTAASGASISMVRTAGRDAVLMYDNEAANGDAAVCLRISAAGASPLVALNGVPYKRLGPEQCQSTTRVPTNGASSLQLGGHASGAFVEADGHVSWIPRKRGKVTQSGLTAVDSPGSTLTARALVPGDDGGVRFLFQQGPGSDAVKLGGTEYLFGTSTQTELQLPDTFFSLTAGVAFISPLTSDEGDRGSLLVRTDDEMLWLVQVSSAGMTTPVQLGRLGGNLSVQATQAGHEILRVTSDGQIDRLHLRAGHLSLEPLARVDVPAHTYADAAFLFRDPAGDFLVLAMFEHAAESKGNGFRLFQSVGAVAGSATRTALPPRVSMTSAGANGDQLICLPPGGEPISTSGWTLGDAPVGAALHVTPGGRCVLLVRGPGQLGSSSQNLAHDTVTGALPGVGRVALIGLASGGPVNSHAPGVPHLLAPLKDGTVAHPSRKYGRGIVALEPRALATRSPMADLYGDLLAMSLNPPFIDLRGDGLWGARSSFAPNGTDVVRFGSEFFHRTYAGGSVELRGVSEKGGLLVSLQDGPGLPSHWARQTTAAANVDLPDPPTGGTYAIELKDGTLCGDLFDPSVDMVSKYFCRAVDGRVRMAPATNDSHFSSAIPLRGALPLADGSLLVTGWKQLYRFNTTAMTSSVFLEGQLWLGVGSNGSVWGATVAADGAIALYSLEPSGPRLLTRPGDYKMPSEGVAAAYQLVVADDVIAVVSKSIDLYMVRIPRPR
ncbi:MAG: hypothetical protein Q8L14_25175 [Myxococcales bacterium]|nr:hypothetical protein [Myxococcales bacterium]